MDTNKHECERTAVIHHSADYDGLFCREIARKFMPEATIIGWDFGQPKITLPTEGRIYVLDLPPDCLELPDINEVGRRLTWIDHHKSSIEKWPDALPGYRIDGVAACRLAWQWFSLDYHSKAKEVSGRLPLKHAFLKREVREPMAVTLAGEYDVWQHENSDSRDITFQFGLDATKLDWSKLLSIGESSATYLAAILEAGKHAQEYMKKREADIILSRGFDLGFEGLNFIALNTARCNSQSFQGGVRPEHDGCLAFYWNGNSFRVSLYGVEHKPEIDLSIIAVKYGGGGHKQACGFARTCLPWCQIESDPTPKKLKKES